MKYAGPSGWICTVYAYRNDWRNYVKVSGSGGGVLCEACWKVMYLPKVGHKLIPTRDGTDELCCSAGAARR